MCKTHNPRKIDKCMKILIENLNEYFGDDIITVAACCCGHGKYPMSLLVKQYFPETREKYQVYDWCSGKYIPRKKRFYVKDNQGYYYIPETVLPTKHNSRTIQSAKKCLNPNHSKERGGCGKSKNCFYE